MVKLNPYLNFKSNAREAMEFYKSVFGGELVMTTFKEGGMAQTDADNGRIMHAMLVIGPEMTLMASDAPEHIENAPVGGFSISLSGESSDEEKLKGYWEKLLEGGKATMPLELAPWGDTFGMLTDKFGTDWMVNIAGKKE